VGRQLDDVRPVAAGDRLAHLDAEESLLEVSVVWPGGAEGVVAGVIELRGCLGPHARLPRVDKTTGPVGVYSAAGCDGLAVAVAGPAAGEEAVVSLAAPGQEPVELRARPRELSHVAVLPAEGDLTVDAVAGGEVVQTLTWVRPYDCPRGIPTVLLAGVSVVVLLVAAGAFLLTRRP